MPTSNNLKHNISLWLGLGLFLMQSFVYAESALTERIEWKKVPIQLEIRVGHERLVHFPASVKVGVPQALQPKLRTQNVNGTVYFLASKPFDATRIMVRTLDSGQIYLIDLSASIKGGPMNPVQVFVQESGMRASKPALPFIDSHDARAYRYVMLTRFAAQHLYAPARLVRDRPGIVRVPVAREAIALLRGGTIDAAPLVAWRAGGVYVTAVKLTNRSDQAQVLDPRDLRGAWLSATFQHHRLLAQGSDADTTAVYLISARPFEASR